MTRAMNRSIAIMAAATLLCGGGATLMASHAAAGTTPPWETTGKDVNEVGTLALYNSAGTQVTSGSVTDAPLALYIVGSKADTVHPKATMYMYTPKFNTPASAWPGEQLTASTSYPVTGAGVPTVVSSAKGPVVTGHDTDETIASYIADDPNTDTTDAGYVNAYQLRVKTSTDGTYQSMDLVVSGLTMSAGVITGGTWTETYPGLAPTATTTTLAVSPSSAKSGQSVTLTATESAGSSHPAGAVQFLDKGTKLGSAVAVSAAGVATLKTKTLPVGKDAITASFTPTDTTSYAGSTSAAKTVTVSKVALKNTKKPTLSGPHKVGKTEKVKPGKWSPKPSKFTYQWYLGAKKIKHATKSSFKPTSADAKKKISCKVTAKKSGFISASAKSKSVKIKK